MSGGPIQHCGTSRRRQRVADANIDTGGGVHLNGIDFLEVIDRDAPSEDLRQRLLDVTFIRPDGAVAGAVALLGPDNFRIEGGSRVRNVRVTQVAKGAGDRTLRLTLDRYGDFSAYRLFVRISATNPDPPPFIDRMLAAVDFHFKVECPSEFDCEAPEPESPRRDFGPPLNYLAKDYASFRQLMLDRMAATIPEWTERNPADVGVTLVEALAHAADQTSWFQDAVHTEAFLGRARLRQSALRHARLLGYEASEGCNARVAVALEAAQDDAGTPLLPVGTRLLTRPLRISGTPPAVLAPDPELFEELVSGGSIVFETLEPVASIRVARNEMQLHDWGDDACCLLPGSTAAWLVGSKAALGLARGDLLILEERIPFGGSPDDPPDPAHRQVVRLSADPVEATDPVMAGVLVLRVDWHEEDALRFPLTLRREGGIDGAVAIGNVVLADEGRTIDFGLAPNKAGADGIAVGGPDDTGLLPDEGPGTRLRYRLDADAVVRAPPWKAEVAAGQSAAAALAPDPAEAVAQVLLTGDGERWAAVPDLLATDRFTPAVKVEPADAGGGYVLFGDGSAGRLPAEGAAFQARIRVGGGRRGNVAAEGIGHVVAAGAPNIAVVRNPVPGAGGRDPEPTTSIRIAAPFAFRRQRRAVTPADYAAAAMEHPDVQRAQAERRWTGSWHTLFLAVDRLGGREVDAAFEESLRTQLASRRLAGHDLEIVPPRYVPLDIAFYVCVCGDHYPADVERDLLDVFSSGYRRNGQPGFFNPDNFSFGDNVLLSRLIAEGMGVEGVLWMGVRDAAGAAVGHFRRLDQPDVDYEADAEIPIARDEVARLDNDPNYPDFGRLRLIMAGGR
ncbi:MAG: hypothetical protein QOJ27_657 [Sphingomonadales bacterium]|nr:hypothetical protein [Sphingomonadales bacterium]